MHGIKEIDLSVYAFTASGVTRVGRVFVMGAAWLPFRTRTRKEADEAAPHAE